MEEIFEKELLIRLLLNDYKQIELKDLKRKLNFHITNYDDTYKLEISKQINLKEEEFLILYQEIMEIYKEKECESIEFPKSKTEFPILKKIWEVSYQENENNYKKEGSKNYPKNWNHFIEKVTKKYMLD